MAPWHTCVLNVAHPARDKYRAELIPGIAKRSRPMAEKTSIVSRTVWQAPNTQSVSDTSQRAHHGIA
eukprot:3521749-Rhodomonas_salina.1